MYHLCRIIVHINHIVGVGDFHALGQVLNAMLSHDLQNILSPANQGNLYIKGLCRLNRAHYGCFRGMVTAHCVKNDLHSSRPF